MFTRHKYAPFPNLKDVWLHPRLAYCCRKGCVSKPSKTSHRKKSHNQSGDGRRMILGVSGAGDPDDEPEPGKSRPWLWRVMRAALPFQMAIVALFCVACLLEPHCCDAINNLNLSLTPQLRYVRGPPPV